MTVSELLTALDSRGVRVTCNGSKLLFVPASLLTNDELAFAQTHIESIVAALRAPKPKPPDDVLELDRKVEDVLRQEAEAEERRLARVMAPPQPLVRFRVPGPFGDQYKPLHRLTTEDVIRLRERGSISDEEVRSWLAMRNAKPTGFLF